jgi:Brp/Blh family beta-carotene 15,15'-monooxygenase
LGFLLVLFQQFFITISRQTEFIVFIFSIILLGIPHGAADILVANRNAIINHKLFSTFQFLFVYISRLLIFAFLIWLFPVVGNILFIVFAAYHFGETDLNQFNTNHLLGKLFIVSYGLIILATILLHHFSDVKQIFLLFQSGQKYAKIINWIEVNRLFIYVGITLNFIVFTTWFFVKNSRIKNPKNGMFLIRLIAILFILYHLPMLLGFTFYFVFWHSFLSLRYIFLYLKNNNMYSNAIIYKQLITYSALAIIGIVLFGAAGFMFTSSNAMAGYVFLGLAVLTVPHMEVMHNMYYNIRLKKWLT